MRPAPPGRTLVVTNQEVIMSEPHTNRLRASDTEREEVASRLRDAMAEGRLTLDEGEQRLASVYAATYRDELPGLVADLPPAEPTGPDRRTGRGGRARSGWPRPVVPVLGLLVAGAVVTGLWVATAGGQLWPVIVLGVLAFILLKRRRHRFGRGAGPGYGYGYGYGCHHGGRGLADRTGERSAGA
jgi:hypothetical protein